MARSAAGAARSLPIYATAKVHRDHHIEVAKALYSVPQNLIGGFRVREPPLSRPLEARLLPGFLPDGRKRGTTHRHRGRREATRRQQQVQRHPAPPSPPGGFLPHRDVTGTPAHRRRPTRRSARATTPSRSACPTRPRPTHPAPRPLSARDVHPANHGSRRHRERGSGSHPGHPRPTPRAAMTGSYAPPSTPFTARGVADRVASMRNREVVGVVERLVHRLTSTWRSEATPSRCPPVG